MVATRKWRSCVIQEEIASVFAGRFRCGLLHFFGEEKLFLTDKTDLKIIARWRYDWCANVREKFKNLRKWVQSFSAHYFDHLEASWKKVSIPQSFTKCIGDVHPYKNISLPHYSVPRKTVKFVPVVQKAQGRANVCAHRKSINPCNSKKMFWELNTGWFVVVHPYSNVSLRRQMAPIQSIEFQTANFPILCARIIVIFWTTCIGMKGFSIVVMGNGKQVLPVLQCFIGGIAFVSSSTIWAVFGKISKANTCSWRF